MARDAKRIKSTLQSTQSIPYFSSYQTRGVNQQCFLAFFFKLCVFLTEAVGEDIQCPPKLRDNIFEGVFKTI